MLFPQTKPNAYCYLASFVERQVPGPYHLWGALHSAEILLK